MSKSYKKNIRLFICTGSNTEWYRARNRMIRNIHRSHIRNVLANFPIEIVDDILTFKKFPKEDTWEEPTDGHYVYTKDMHERDKRLLRNCADVHKCEHDYREFIVNQANRVFKQRFSPKHK